VDRIAEDHDRAPRSSARRSGARRRWTSAHRCPPTRR
jgi:hypothetical protein